MNDSNNNNNNNKTANFSGWTSAFQIILLASVPWAIIIYFGFYF
jgi:hypothetical protein